MIYTRILWLPFASFPIKIPNLGAMAGWPLPSLEKSAKREGPLHCFLSLGVVGDHFSFTAGLWGQRRIPALDSLACLTRVMEKATWKREETGRTCSPFWGGNSLPPGGPVIEGQQQPITQVAAAAAAGDMPKRGPGGRGEGACDVWPAYYWKRLTPQERGTLTFGGFGAINHRPGCLKRIEYIQFYRILSFI